MNDYWYWYFSVWELFLKELLSERLTLIIPVIGITLRASCIKLGIRAIRFLPATTANFLFDPLSFYCATPPPQKKKGKPLNQKNPSCAHCPSPHHHQACRTPTATTTPRARTSVRPPPAFHCCWPHAETPKFENPNCRFPPKSWNRRPETHHPPIIIGRNWSYLLVACWFLTQNHKSIEVIVSLVDLIGFSSKSRKR